MGLDSVDLVVAIENAFDIKIPDAEAAEATTVGALYDTVWRHIEARPRGVCNSQINFYRFRKAVQHIVSPNIIITPATHLEDLIPKPHRRRIWRQIGKESGLRLPPLTIPTRIKYIVLLLIDALFLAIIFSLPSRIPFWPALLSLLALNMLVDFALIPFRTRFEAHTVGELINTAQLKNAKYISNRTAMESVIKEIISEQLGIDHDEITPEKSFVKDFGIR